MTEFKNGWQTIVPGKASAQLLRKHRTRLIFALVGVAFVGLLASRLVFNGDADKTTRGKGPATISVELALATRRDQPVLAEGLGTIQAFYTVTATARVDGQLQKVAFTEGQAVKQGDLLAQIDPRPYQAALDLAVATKQKDDALLDNAKRDLERYITLAPEDFTSKQTVDTQRALVAQLEAQVKGDQATIDNARTQLDYTTITSPIDGITGIRLVDPGNNVHATDTTGIVVVTKVQPISLVFTMPEEMLPAINKAMAAGPLKVKALSRDDKTELDEGTVQLIDNRIDQATGTIHVKATFPNIHNALWPGQFVNARMVLDTRRNVLTIPEAALQRGPSGPFTYVVQDDSTVKVQLISVSDVSNGVVVVDKGLSDGARVVTSNQYRLQPGSHVQLRTDPSSNAAGAAP